MSTVKHIHLWSGPRNVSTALMYSFAQRPDTQVVDEPLYGYFLEKTGIDHPGREETLAAMETDGQKVVDSWLNLQQKHVVFFKQMTHHLLDLDRSFMKDACNVLLIRNPSRVLASYTKVIPNPSLDDIGICQSLELANWLNDQGAHCLVVNGDDIRREPEKMLRMICSSCDIPFYSSMLEWEAGARPEDGPWAKYWYGSVHRSDGFELPATAKPDVPSHLKGIEAEAMKCYHSLQQYN